MAHFIRKLRLANDDRYASISLSAQWNAMKEKLENSSRIIDLGCGNNPVHGATVGVDPPWDDKRRRWATEKETNPFDILLNDGGWYRGREAFPRLPLTSEVIGTLMHL